MSYQDDDDDEQDARESCPWLYGMNLVFVEYTRPGENWFAMIFDNSTRPDARIFGLAQNGLCFTGVSKSVTFAVTFPVEKKANETPVLLTDGTEALSRLFDVFHLVFHLPLHLARVSS